MIRVIDHKAVEMTDQEFEYYQQLIANISEGGYDGKYQFHDVFDVDGEGCISLIRPPMGTEIYWSVLMFLQNLMINQRLRRMERKIEEILNGQNSNDA